MLLITRTLFDDVINLLLMTFLTSQSHFDFPAKQTAG